MIAQLRSEITRQSTVRVGTTQHTESGQPMAGPRPMCRLALGLALPLLMGLAPGAEAVRQSTRLLHGVAIDTYSLMHGLDFTHPSLLLPATALAPPLLRVGGSAQRSYPVCFGAEHPEPLNATCLTRRYWCALCDFAAAINTSMIYGLHNDADPRHNLALLAAVAASTPADSSAQLDFPCQGVFLRDCAAAGQPQRLPCAGGFLYRQRGYARV